MTPSLSFYGDSGDGQGEDVEEVHVCSVCGNEECDDEECRAWIVADADMECRPATAEASA
jgi:hypothetical protein